MTYCILLQINLNHTSSKYILLVIIENGKQNFLLKDFDFDRNSNKICSKINIFWIFLNILEYIDIFEYFEHYYKI